MLSPEGDGAQQTARPHAPAQLQLQHCVLVHQCDPGQLQLMTSVERYPIWEVCGVLL